MNIKEELEQILLTNDENIIDIEVTEVSDSKGNEDWAVIFSCKEPGFVFTYNSIKKLSEVLEFCNKNQDKYIDYISEENGI